MNINTQDQDEALAMWERWQETGAGWYLSLADARRVLERRAVRDQLRIHEAVERPLRGAVGTQGQTDRPRG